MEIVVLGHQKAFGEKNDGPISQTPLCSPSCCVRPNLVYGGVYPVHKDNRQRLNLVAASLSNIGPPHVPSATCCWNRSVIELKKSRKLRTLSPCGHLT